MKKVFAILLTILLIFTACSYESSDLTDSKKPANSEPGKSLTSSIFGRNLKYDEVTPAESFSLPIDISEITDMLQIGKSLYFLTYGSVYTLDIESGNPSKLFDTDATMFASYGDTLYTYSAKTSTLSEHDASGSVTKTLTLEVTDVESVEGLLVTDDYYVFNCYISGKTSTEPYILVYSRETEELTLSKKTTITRIYPYKGNKLLTVTVDDIFNLIHLNVFDAESGKNEELQNLGNYNEVGYRPAVAYCSKTDTVLVYSGGANLGGNSPCCITEYSLTDADNIVHNRYYLEVSDETKFFISVYENIVSAISTADNEYRIFDYLNPPESITILGNATVQDVVYSFEKETGILVKNAYTDFDKLVLKLMAGDNDFDIYNTGSGFHNYVDSGAYVDLKEIERLNSRISGNAAADLVVSYDGKYFGVPTGISNIWTEEYYPENGSSFSYSRIISENIYYAKNIDIAENRYSDPDGDELYKLLKFLNDNPEGNRKKMPFGEEVTILSSNVYLLNPQSQNSDNAIRFLEYLYDAFNGDIPGIVSEADLYPRLESTENCYVEWRCRPIDIIQPIMDARIAIQNQNADLSNSELKKLAKEAAAEVRMRMME